MISLRRLFLTAVLVTLTASGVWGQAKLHASYKVAEKYARAVHLHQWEEAADLVETRSLENLKILYMMYGKSLLIK